MLATGMDTGLPGIAAGAKVKASFGGNSVLTPISNTVKAA
jgi:hypothetical protein